MKIELDDNLMHGVRVGPDGGLMFEGISREDALRAVGGGDGGDMDDGTKAYYADNIMSAAAGNAAWRSTLNAVQQMALVGTPVVFIPAEEPKSVGKDSSDKGGKSA